MTRPLALLIIFWHPIVWGVVLGLILGTFVVNVLSSSGVTTRIVTGAAGPLDDGSALPMDERIRPIARGKLSIPDIIREAALEFSQSPDEMLAVARCESSLNPMAVGDGGAAIGLWQFWPRTWSANATRFFGYDVGDLRTDPTASSRVAAWMWSRGQRWQWSCR